MKNINIQNWIVLFHILGILSVYPKENWESYDAWDAKGGCWEIKDSIIYGRNYWGFCKFIYQDDFTDFVFKVRLAKIEESGPISLIFRYDEIKDIGYHLLVFPFSCVNFARIDCSLNEYFFGANTMYWKQGLNVWNTITIEASGAKFDIYINDEFIFSYTDDEFSRGKLALMVAGDVRQSAKFEILEITAK